MPPPHPRGYHNNNYAGHHHKEPSISGSDWGREKSEGKTISMSRIDINTRLKEIQEEKKNSVRGSRVSEGYPIGGYQITERSVSKDSNKIGAFHRLAMGVGVKNAIGVMPGGKKEGITAN